jgi:hypothetical protein
MKARTGLRGAALALMVLSSGCAVRQRLLPLILVSAASPPPVPVAVAIPVPESPPPPPPPAPVVVIESEPAPVASDEATVYPAVPPPDPIPEIRPQAPCCGYSWIEGNWDWDGHDWTWSSGYWAERREGRYYAPRFVFVDGRPVYYRAYWQGASGRREFGYGARGFPEARYRARPSVSPVAWRAESTHNQVWRNSPGATAWHGARASAAPMASHGGGPAAGFHQPAVAPPGGGGHSVAASPPGHAAAPASPPAHAAPIASTARPAAPAGGGFHPTGAARPAGAAAPASHPAAPAHSGSGGFKKK